MDEAPDPSVPGGPIRESAVDGACPYCGAATLVMRSLPLTIPYFGDALQTTVLCSSCSFRHADLILMREGPPVRYKMRATTGDLDARVVRSSAATIRIPELGLRVEPGLRAEAFVTNPEGVLHRLEPMVSMVARSAETAAAKRKGERTLAALKGMIAGTKSFTIVLEDPTGNSAILHERAQKTLLSDKEARRLKRGVPEFRVVP